METPCNFPSVEAPTDGDKYTLRFPPGMRDRLARASRESGRSINSEILTRLASTFEAPATDPIKEELHEIRKQLEKLQEMIRRRA